MLEQCYALADTDVIPQSFGETRLGDGADKRQSTVQASLADGKGTKSNAAVQHLGKQVLTSVANSRKWLRGLRNCSKTKRQIRDVLDWVRDDDKSTLEAHKPPVRILTGL